MPEFWMSCVIKLTLPFFVKSVLFAGIAKLFQLKFFFSCFFCFLCKIIYCFTNCALHLQKWFFCCHVFFCLLLFNNFMSRCADLHCGPHSYQECALLPELHRHAERAICHAQRGGTSCGQDRTCTYEG